MVAKMTKTRQKWRINEISRKPARTVAELASARQHLEKNLGGVGGDWPALMERAVEGQNKAK